MGKNGKTRHQAEWQNIKDAIELVSNDFPRWQDRGWECNGIGGPLTSITRTKNFTKPPIGIQVHPETRLLVSIVLTTPGVEVLVWAQGQRHFLPGPWYLVLLDEMKAIKSACDQVTLEKQEMKAALVEDPYLFENWSVNHD